MSTRQHVVRSASSVQGVFRTQAPGQGTRLLVPGRVPSGTRQSSAKLPRPRGNGELCFPEVLLGVPQSLQQRSGALVPHAGVLLPEGPAVPLEELRQHRVFAAIRPLVFQLSRESEVRFIHVRFCVKSAA